MPWRGAISRARGPFRGYGPFAQKLPWGLNRRPTPTLLLDFAGTRAVDSRITFTRSSTATYFDAAGVLQTAAINTPRIDFDPATKACRGLLIEEARTNLVSQPCDLTAAGWSASNITAAANQTGPDNASNSASSITATADAGTILFAITSASAARSTTAYVKRITGTGAVEMTQDGGSTWAAVTVTSAWTRVSVTSATVTNPSVGFRLATNGDAIAVFCAQCETGAFSTSAIPSAGSLTRNADVALMTGANLSSWYNPAGGTLFGEFSIPQALASGAGARVFTVAGEAGSDEVLLFVSQASGKSASFNCFSGGANVGRLDAAPAFVADTLIKAAATYALNERTVTAGGAPPTVSTTAFTIPTVTSASVGVAASGLASLNGHIRRIVYCNRRLGNSQLQALTR